MNKTYVRVRLYKVPDHLEDPITQLSFDHGATGLSEVLAFTQPDLTYDPHLVPQKARDFDAYFKTMPSRDYFQRLQEMDSRISTETFEEIEKDWLEEWKKGFKPFALAGPYWIVPSWLESPVDAEHSIQIDPGMAFGTGTHATTKMASTFLYKRAQELGDLAKKSSRLLDVGTGTAVLAILGERLGFKNPVGVEIDPEARRVARENVERNNSVTVSIPEEQLDQIDQEFETVVANIIDGVLINLSSDLARVTKAGGDLFCTGILAEREQIFFDGFIKDSPWSVHRRWENEEWIGYWLRKKA